MNQLKFDNILMYRDVDNPEISLLKELYCMKPAPCNSGDSNILIIKINFY